MATLQYKSTVNQSRLAVLGMFFINGALMATWISRIPQIQDKLGLSEGQLGIVLLGLSAGVLTALSVAGGLVARYGSRRVTVTAAFILALLLISLPWMPNSVALWLNLFVFGMALSTMDVAMNAQAVEVEARAERPLMTTFHASWSVGGFVSAAIGAAMASMSVEPQPHFVFGAVLFGSLIFVFRRHLLFNVASEEADEQEQVFRLPPRVLWPLGIVAFAGAIGEGAMADWSGVYLSDVVHTDDATAALGFTVFSIMMTMGRLFGDRLAARFSPARLVQLGGLVATAGLLLAIFLPTPITTLVGFAAVGLGVSTVVPLAFSAAGRIPGISASVGIASVATIGYAGFLAGPPVIGLIAEATSLQLALLVFVATLTATLVITGRELNKSKSLH
ncbi:MAG: MFS transporter [Anaerolineaceae bacterium]|nr:MFS transporter [Anaerolineaceae bacterium]